MFLKNFPKHLTSRFSGRIFVLVIRETQMGYLLSTSSPKPNPIHPCSKETLTVGVFIQI